MANACVKSNRYVRGGIGFLLGGLAGAILGAGAFVIAGQAAAKDVASGGNPLDQPLWIVMLPPTVGLIGAGIGTYIGARKPQCE